MQTIIGRKKRCSSLFLAANRRTFSHQEKKKSPDAWSSSCDNVFFLILRDQCLVSVKGNILQGRHGKKGRPAVAHFAEELQNPFSNPYIDSHGTAQIHHRSMTCNSGTFSLPV